MGEEIRYVVLVQFLRMAIVTMFLLGELDELSVILKIGLFRVVGITGANNFPSQLLKLMKIATKAGVETTGFE